MFEVEVIGYIGMILVLISFTMKDMRMLRILNSIACGIFAVYGMYHETYPIVVMNILVILINIYFLVKSSKQNT